MVIIFGKCEAHRKSICFCDCGAAQSILRMLNFFFFFCIDVCAYVMFLALLVGGNEMS